MTHDDRLHMALPLFARVPALSSELLFAWLNYDGTPDYPQTEIMEPPADLDEDDWAWVSHDELAFYRIESILFPSGNDSALKLAPGETYTDWILHNKMCNTAARLDKLLEEDTFKERLVEDVMDKDSITYTMLMYCVHIQRRQDKARKKIEAIKRAAPRKKYTTRKQT